jgi:hypothetical protein
VNLLIPCINEKTSKISLKGFSYFDVINVIL